MNSVTITPKDVSKVANLAKIPVTPDEERELAEGFTTTMGVVEKLREVDVTKTPPTHRLTDLENIFREDVIEEKRMFTQEQALANATRTYNGFFVVDAVLTNEL